MSNETYNGWKNYPTWRVHLEMFDGMEIDYPISPEDLREMAEDAIEMSENQLARDFAMAFLAGVDWHEIADHLNENFSTDDEEQYVFDPATQEIDAFVPPRSLEIAKTYARFMLERKIGDQDPDPYAGSEWAGGREG